MKLINKKYFVCTDLEKNSNKFWKISLYDNNDVVTEYGRVGDSGQSTTKSFENSAKAEKFFNSKVAEKSKVKSRRDAYTEINILEDKVVASKHISDIAAEEIETASPEVRQLIKWFSDVNIHNITRSTTISYNINDGCFKTPLGVVDLTCIKTAKELLDEISKFPDKTGKECIKKINQYLRYIPQDLGGSHVKIHVEDVFGTGDLLQKQADIIEGLEAAITKAKPVASAKERLFNTKLDIVTDDKVITEIKERFRRHSNDRRISNIYEVHIEDVNVRFNSYGTTVGNVDRLWHGTNPSNLLSILKVGLVIPKSYSNGWRFGAGVYFSDKSSMSLNYTPSNRRDNNEFRYMFLSDVARGNICYSSGRSLEADYNSRWMERNCDTSQIIIYRTDQCNLKYLLEIKN